MNTVSIKGNKYGVVVSIKNNAEFEDVKIDCALKFQEAAKFLGKARVAVSFEGRELTPDEEWELVDIIELNCKLKIACIMDESELLTRKFKDVVERVSLRRDVPDGEFISPATKQNDYIPDDEIKMQEYDGDLPVDQQSNENVVPSRSIFQIYKGVLRSGQVIESETSIIIFGDVKVGATVVSKGNIIVLGSLLGEAYAGVETDRKCFVLALAMHPIKIMIGDIIARAPDSQQAMLQSAEQYEPMIAFLADENDETISIENLSKSVMNDIII